MSLPNMQGAFKSSGAAPTPSKQERQSGKSRKQHPPPLSLRLSEHERRQLEREAGSLTLSAHIRRKLFGETIAPRQNDRSAYKPRQPRADHQALARVLAALGQSRLASNLNQIAKLAHQGALPVDGELSGELQQACADIAAMRIALMQALGKYAG